MKKSLFVIILALASHLFLSPLAYGIKTKDALKGISVVELVIGDIDPVAREFGLNKEKIRADVKLQLSLAGIDMVKNFSLNFLNLSINTSYQDGYFVYLVALEFFQKAQLTGISLLYAGTWTDESFGLVSDSQMEQKIRQVVKDTVDRFVNDYLSVNPI